MALAAVGPAPASVLSDNTGNASYGEAWTSTSQWFFEAFTTDNHTYRLDSVMLPVWGEGATPFVSLYSDNPSGYCYLCGGTTETPGTVISALALSGTAFGWPGTVFTATGVTLAPDTTYWILGGSTSGSFYWDQTNTATGLGVGYTGRNGYTLDAAASWNWVTNPEFYIPQMQVNATEIESAAPEPTALFMLPFGLAGLVLGIRRRR